MNFDERINRYNTNCLKYDFKKERNKPEDVFPCWVADMDFKCCDSIINALQEKIEHGIFGYSKTDDRYFKAVFNWFEKNHNIEVKKEWLITTPGIVFALAMAVRTLTKEGENILINNPVYYPFKEVIEDNKRNAISSDLINNNGHYEIDFKDFENKIVENNIHLYLLCSPHNPVGRVWNKDELDKIISICKKHNVFIVSDEIHSDFIWENKHISILTYNQLDNVIVCTSPSKTFNLAGLQMSNIFIPNKKVRENFQLEIYKTGYSTPNIMGIVATIAAYEDGGYWFNNLKKYLKENIEFTEKYINENISDVKVIHPEGTYLLWLDFKGLNISDDELNRKIINDAKLWLDNGTMFGPLGSGYQRLNIAMPRKDLEYVLNQIKETFVK